ncbi:MAG: DUF2252 domain-containing protein [Vulcanococcus sp.]
MKSGDPTPSSFEAWGQWSVPPDRPDPIARLEEQNRSRLPWLIAERHRRMAVNPFAWFRGTAAQMASDLNALPRSSHRVQLCGDAHLMNFGFYASPERSLVFDINDFDETAPGPFEWDLKRLLVSVVLVARQLKLEASDQERLARKVAGGYRKAISSFAALPTLKLWNTLLHVERFVADLPQTAFRRDLECAMNQALRRTGRQAVQKLCEFHPDGTALIRHEPPLIWRHRLVDQEWLAHPDHDHAIAVLMAGYRESLPSHRRYLLSRFEIVDTAFKAVGVGSVGTRCAIGLLKGPHADDWFLLQSKQALPSCLPGGDDAEQHQGQRVVEGQRLMQCVSDPFLGWITTPRGVQLYWRQLRDWKSAISLEAISPDSLKAYGRLCASVLARAHARSGDPDRLSAELGEDKRFDRAMAGFAVAYADQVETDHRSMLQAMASGRLTSSG